MRKLPSSSVAHLKIDGSEDPCGRVCQMQVEGGEKTGKTEAKMEGLCLGGYEEKGIVTGQE